MLEVEYKARVHDRSAFEAGLRDVGARSSGAHTETDVYYRHPVRSFAATDEALRVRTVQDGQDTQRVLTYKGPRHAGPTRSREEVEVRIEGDLDRVLVALSFVPAGRVQKTRHVHHLDDLVVTLDEVEGLGLYAEVEAMAPDAAGLERARAQVLELVARLGLGPEERRSYLEMVLAQGTDSSGRGTSQRA